MSEQAATSDGPGAAGSTPVGDGPSADAGARADVPRRRLPRTQPWRALVVCLAYVLVVLAALVLSTQLYRFSVALFITIGLAALLTVPLAVVAPLPRNETVQPDAARPVLHRARRGPKR